MRDGFTRSKAMPAAMSQSVCQGAPDRRKVGAAWGRLSQSRKFLQRYLLLLLLSLPSSPAELPPRSPLKRPLNRWWSKTTPPPAILCYKDLTLHFCEKTALASRDSETNPVAVQLRTLSMVWFGNLMILHVRSQKMRTRICGRETAVCCPMSVARRHRATQTARQGYASGR
jgi:hypothetical protein